jgi:hypothetical protein
MKTCSKCKTEKELSDFYKDRRRPDGKACQCKSCMESYQKPNRKKNCADYYQRKKAFVDSFKTPCVKCGEPEKACIDFHHLDPNTKDFTIAKAQFNRERIKQEVEKCVCLCANCHRKLHAGLFSL